MNATGDRRTAVADILLERYRLGELPREELQRVKALAREDAALAARLQSLEQSDRDIDASYPAADLAADVLRRVASACPPRADGRLRAAWLVPTMAAAVALVVAAVAVNVVPWARSGASVDDDTRAKGADTTLLVYRDSESGGHPLADGDRAREGDVVRLGYRVASRGFGVIISIDGRGVVTAHLPDKGTEAVALEPGEMVLLNRAFELDDAPRVERFFLVSAAHPFALQAVADAVGAADREPNPTALRLPSGFSYTSFSLRKDLRP